MLCRACLVVTGTAPSALPGANRAIELRAAGWTYQAIGDDRGYKNREAMHNMVGKALAHHEEEAVGELRTLEVARLDALQAAVWDRAMHGDIEAATAALRVTAARCKVLGPDGGAGLKVATPRTVVQSGA